MGSLKNILFVLLFGSFMFTLLHDVVPHCHEVINSHSHSHHHHDHDPDNHSLFDLMQHALESIDSSIVTIYERGVVLNNVELFKVLCFVFAISLIWLIREKETKSIIKSLFTQSLCDRIILSLRGPPQISL
jgi:hypothetical protein